jgi:hypothetical protein
VRSSVACCLIRSPLNTLRNRERTLSFLRRRRMRRRHNRAVPAKRRIRGMGRFPLSLSLLSILASLLRLTPLCQNSKHPSFLLSFLPSFSCFSFPWGIVRRRHRHPFEEGISPQKTIAFSKYQSLTLETTSRAVFLDRRFPRSGRGR